jgi:hypothetical protein
MVKEKSLKYKSIVKFNFYKIILYKIKILDIYISQGKNYILVV